MPDSGGGVRALVAGAMVVLTLGPQPAPVRANGGTVRLAKIPAGPYLVSAWTQPDPPRVGRLDLSVAVMRPQTEAPVLDATVQVRAERADGSGTPVTVALARGGGGNPLYAHAVLGVPAAGRWRMTVGVEGPSGTGAAAFELDVAPPRPLVWVLLPGMLIGLGLMWWIVRQSGRPRWPAGGSAPAGPGERRADADRPGRS